MYPCFFVSGHMIAQCGGAIAGASVMLAMFGSSAEMKMKDSVLGMEFLLTFMIVLTYLRVTQHFDSLMAATAIGLSYMSSTVSFSSTLNPAFALGRAFVVNKFGELWMFWLGPLLGKHLQFFNIDIYP